MKVRVPGRQFAAAARETPGTSESGRGRTYYVYFTVSYCDLFIHVLRNYCFADITASNNEDKVGNTHEEERI